MVSPAELHAVLPTLLELLYLRIFGFLIRGFFGKIFLHYNLI